MNEKKLYRREITTEGLQVRESGAGEPESRTITGRAIVFDTPTTLWGDDETEVREQISADAVTKQLLDSSDIKMTMFHNRELILARSCNGKGTLRYTRTETGVDFEFDAPHTVDGDKALALVRSGDLSGCSFAFSVGDWDTYADRTVTKEGDRIVILYTVREIAAIHDFTIAADPAYPTTEVSARCRELVEKRETPGPAKVSSGGLKARYAKMRREIFSGR